MFRHEKTFEEENDLPFSFKIVERGNQLEALGFDEAFWDLNVCMDGFTFEIRVSMRELLDYFDTLPGIGEYAKKIRNGIVGYGGKHSKMLQTMAEEGFNPEEYLEEFIHKHVDLKTRMDDAKRIQSQTPMQDSKRREFEKSMKELDETVLTMRESSKNWDDFAERMLEATTAIALKVYPEIFNAESHFIKDFEGIIYNHVRRITEEVEKLASDAAKTVHP